MNKPNFLWLRFDSKELNQSIESANFHIKINSNLRWKISLKCAMNMAKNLLPLGSEDAYMSTNDRDLPTFEYTYYQNNAYTKEVKQAFGKYRK